MGERSKFVSFVFVVLYLFTSPMTAPLHVPGGGMSQLNVQLFVVLMCVLITLSQCLCRLLSRNFIWSGLASCVNLMIVWEWLISGMYLLSCASVPVQIGNLNLFQQQGCRCYGALGAKASPPPQILSQPMFSY